MAQQVAIRTDPPAIDPEQMTRPQDYVMEDEDLRAATNAALTLGKPLLLTGEAGVGKSEFASWLAHELQPGAGKLKFVVKTTTEARDLFYYYDALARFHEAQIAEAAAPGEKPGAREVAVHRYIEYNALGKAILYSLGREAARSSGFLSDAAPAQLESIPLQRQRAVVLIDEIDKAPRDVPNDILDEIDKLAFSVRELGNIEARADPAHRPVVVLTSNSERDLPKPFLRRCVYYHMQFPGDAALARIVDQRVGARFAAGSALLGESTQLFRYLREQAGLRQPPGLAELLDWLHALSDAPGGPPGRLADHAGLEASAKATLLKDRHDQERMRGQWETWLRESLE